MKKDRSVHWEKNCEKFLEENRGLIVKEANKRFGKGNYANAEVMSEAAIAYYDMTSYLNGFKRTKSTSMFWYFLNKRFDELQGIGVVDDCTAGFQENTDSFEDKALDEVSYQAYCSQSAAEDEFMDLKHDIDMAGGDYAALQQYGVCVDSFKRCGVSKRLLKAMKILGCRTPGCFDKEELAELFGCRRNNGVARKIRSEMIAEIESKGLCIYKGVCVNGSSLTIIVCAPSREKAERHLRKYGTLVELSRWEYGRMPAI